MNIFSFACKRPAPFVLLPLVLMAMLVGVVHDVRAEAYLPLIGGNGGGQFKAPCPQDQNLTGFELRVADDVDAIRPVCVVSTGPSKIWVPPSMPTGWYGGPGGGIQQLLCPPRTPIVIGIDVAAEGAKTIVVNNIHMYCGQAVTTQTPESYPSAIFDAPGYTPSPAWLGIGIGGDPARHIDGHQTCPAGQVAIGVHGSSGVWLDAMGLICDTPRVKEVIKTIGRVKVPTTGPQIPICDAARAARKRDSPAAPGLEAQCRASGGTP